LRFIFSRESLSNGINFGDKGPGDQGAYHEFYQGKFYVVGLPSFNWKAYWDFNPHAKIVHFHGPKPKNFETFFKTNETSGYKNFDRLMQTNCWGNNGCQKYLALYKSFLTQDKVIFSKVNMTSSITHQNLPVVSETDYIRKIRDYCKDK